MRENERKLLEKEGEVSDLRIKLSDAEENKHNLGTVGPINMWNRETSLPVVCCEAYFYKSRIVPHKGILWIR